jgi:hypothetical protein
MNLVTSVNAIVFSAENGANVDDLIINNIHTGGTGTGMVFSDRASYRSNISIATSQFDAGITVGINMSNYNSVTISGLNMGGGVVNILNSLHDLRCYSAGC